VARDPSLAQLRAALKRGGKGEIRLVLPLPDRGREVELLIPGRWDVSPARAGILAMTPGRASRKFKRFDNRCEDKF
jgi:DNA polymerase-3 subunit alpha